MKVYMNNHVHPLLRDIINSFAAEASIPVRPMAEFDESDFIKSDYCTECNGDGESLDFSGQQCESCEELHRAELRADRMMDEAKGN